ncbi:MAG: response regulator, partial [Myxococcales bacterium]
MVVLDVELEGSQELVERLASDPLTEPVPVVVVGSFATPEKAARWVALGVARVLARPYTPRQLQEACASVIAGAHRAMRPEPFGQLSMTQLVDRLALELRRGLCDSAVDASKLLPVGLGDGHEVMAALWSAIVRIREVATIRSRGAVRFQPLGPEGAVAVASWSSESRAGRPTRGLEEAPRLEGRTVLVADDDPSVTWFLSGVLRAAGAVVIEAHDGEAALHRAYRTCPDLVISDIMMPKLDGFSLCRAIKRDVVLRDVPVILLSWKEDLLQRVRELGANADGYLRKEASAAVVLERVSEVLRPRLRVEKRLMSGGEVRGRLDDLTVRTLLALTSRHQPDARVSVRDAAFLYEVEVRGGAPRSATRTTTDGRFERGPGVLFSLLGVGAGRFVVTPSDAPLRGWLDGSLEEQLRPAVAQMRAAQRLLSGSALMNVQGIDLQLEAIQPYFEASPVLSKSILDKLAEGFSPRTLLLRASHSARLLEDVLNDAILHGGVARVVGNNGEDMLPAAVAEEMLLLERGIAPSMAPPVSEAALYAQFTPSPLVGLTTVEEAPPSPARNSTDIEQALTDAVRHDEASAPPPSVASRVPTVASRERSPVAPVVGQPHPQAPSPAAWRGVEESESEAPRAVELASASDVPRVELELSFPAPGVKDVGQLPEPGSLSPQAQARQKEMATEGLP